VAITQGTGKVTKPLLSTLAHTRSAYKYCDRHLSLFPTSNNVSLGRQRPFGANSVDHGYRRHAITDSAMLQEAVGKLEALHTAEANSQSSVQVSPISTVRL
jgi:hypothetical protein